MSLHQWSRKFHVLGQDVHLDVAIVVVHCAAVAVDRDLGKGAVQEIQEEFLANVLGWARAHRLDNARVELGVGRAERRRQVARFHSCAYRRRQLRGRGLAPALLGGGEAGVLLLHLDPR